MAQASKATLTMKDCQEQAANCRKAAMQVMTAAHRIMLEHIADTWDRIAADIHKANQYGHLSSRPPVGLAPGAVRARQRPRT